MKTYYYMGPNPDTKSKVSWKMWKIERKGRTITVWWGPAIVVNRKITKSGSLQSKSWKYSSEAAAKEDELSRIQSKISSGYKKKDRSITA